VIGGDGSIVESHVARDVCFCCKTAVGVSAGGRVFVAWRHIFPGSIRDIAMAVSSDAGRTFGPMARVSSDDWALSGCPDDGPSLAVDVRNTVHITWPTLIGGETPRKAVFYSRTIDGTSFTPRALLSGGLIEDAGHPQIAADAAGNIAAAWDEHAVNQRNVVVRVAAPGAESFGPAQVLGGSGSGFHPFVTGLDRGFLVAWPERSADRSVIRIQRVMP
jgi:hypothetical protein